MLGEKMLAESAAPWRAEFLRNFAPEGLADLCGLGVLAFAARRLGPESCLTASEMDAATRTALTNGAQHYFDLIAKGDAAALRQSAIPSLAADFSGIEGTIKENQRRWLAEGDSASAVFAAGGWDGDDSARGIFLWVFDRMGRPRTAPHFFGQSCSRKVCRL